MLVELTKEEAVQLSKSNDFAAAAWRLLRAKQVDLRETKNFDPRLWLHASESPVLSTENGEQP